jgi:ubiquitin-like-conjugating enzyme ATG3
LLQVINSSFDVRLGLGTYDRDDPTRSEKSHTHTHRESGDKSRRKDYLPDDKQYLVTRNVPCVSRANDLDNVKSSSGDVSTEDDWLITEEMKSSAPTEEDELKEITIGDEEEDHVITSAERDNVEEEKEDENSGSDSDDYLDMETFEEDNLLDEDDVGELQQEEDSKKEDEEIDNIKLTRTYDVSITYDKYYQTPRVFLFGYNETGQPLKTKEIYQDIMADYVKRTWLCSSA